MTTFTSFSQEENVKGGSFANETDHCTLLIESSKSNTAPLQVSPYRPRYLYRGVVVSTVDGSTSLIIRKVIGTVDTNKQHFASRHWSCVR